MYHRERKVFFSTYPSTELRHARVPVNLGYQVFSAPNYVDQSGNLGAFVSPYSSSRSSDTGVLFPMGVLTSFQF